MSCRVGTPRQPPFRITKFVGLHPDLVRQVDFCEAGLALASVSEADSRSMAYCRLVMAKPHRKAAVVCHASRPKGFSCLCEVQAGVGEDSRVLHVATGSSDCVVRLWKFSVSEAGETNEANPVAKSFVGHSAAISYIFYVASEAAARLYSLSEDRILKVWDVTTTACLLTYRKMATTLEQSDGFWRQFVAHFDRSDQVLVVTAVAVTDGRAAIASLRCGNVRRGLVSGSHETSVVKAAYNRLFDVLVSVSTNSEIAVWNLHNGRVIKRIRMAHTQEVYGKMLPVEISAADYDPSGGLLVTGTVNGAVGMWDPVNTGKCLNRLQIPSKSRITEIFWQPNKVK